MMQLLQLLTNKYKSFSIANKKNEVGEDKIDDVKFRTFGCGSAVATSSMVTTMAKGMKVDDAYEITRKDVAEELDGLPPIKPML